ncbi:sensor domain-containing diguanylate cyclase [Paraglaciecola sp. MB-3u-78]|uniref:GGDEF domain-containing protein n=1 Tax=Paraglaciecola sp. MB-3u-78 TaxID=2058332 RepID=UPI000C326AED|nr:sensor domain-containing diguanylate cyclase [Paraglaciecola sp. MB-3u-78]PKG99029.1 GGDEF domain-containing protein [Paraglaciecola sp. MB-3u-78]
MDFKRLIKNYLNTGVVQSSDTEANQHIFVANLFGFIGYSITFLMGVSAFIRQDRLIGIVLLIASLLFFSSHLILRSKRFANPYKFSANLLTISLMLLMIYLVFTGGVNGTGPLWIYIVPPVALFFGGMRKGTRNIGLFVLIISVLMFYPNDEWLATSYTFEFKSRLIYSFLTVSCLFAFYEYVRQNSFNRIQEMSQKFERQAMEDPLSGLLNRRGMREKLQNEFERSQRYNNDLTVMMCDIDHFKAVNDQYGHDKGDEIIKSLGTIFKSGLRKQDSLARWGGEEYLFLLPETNGNQGMQLAEKLRSQIEKKPYTQDDKIFSISISIGLHQIAATDTINQAITKADTNLYKAKEQGRNRCIIS